MNFKALSFLFLLIVSVASCKSKPKEAIPVAQSSNDLPITPASKSVARIDTTGGIYTEFYDDGKVKAQGKMIDNKREGEWSYFYPNGKIWSYGEYKNGKREGLSNIYHENGVLKIEGQYINGLPSGKWKIYNDKAEVVKEFTR